jgi:nucleoside-diphosphate-sugar epimerase
MTILITGGKGYIAQAIYNALKEEHKITLLTRDDFDLTDSLSVSNWFSDKFFDLVIHTATVGGNRLKKEDQIILNQNLQMWDNLVKNKSHFNNLIHFGSGAEIYAVDTPYGLSKHLINESLKNYSSFTNIRIFAIFDSNELERRFIKSSIKHYINKEPIIIHQNKFMDFFYMEDLISLIKFIILHPEVDLIECCYPQRYSLLDIANLINDLSNYKVPIQIETPSLGTNYTGTYTDFKIKFKGLEKGIIETYYKLQNEY